MLWLGAFQTQSRLIPLSGRGVPRVAVHGQRISAYGLWAQGAYRLRFYGPTSMAARRTCSLTIIGEPAGCP